MTTNHTDLNVGSQTPLLDLLRNVPSDARMVYDHNPFHSQSIPVGRLCHEAADALEAMQDDAARYRWLRDQDHWPACFDSHSAPEPVRGPELDAAIDAARGQG